MQSYDSKKELLDEILKRYQLFDDEFNEVKEKDRKVYVEGVDRNPLEILSYQIGWISLLNSWERDEKKGLEVKTPSKDYKWNELGLLYQDFYKEYDSLSLKEAREKLKSEVDLLVSWVEEIEDEELFIPNKRKWTITNANWPMVKWIHTNTVAPFKTFRTKIRKWKKNLE